MTGAPNGWTRATIADIATLVRGVSYKKGQSFGAPGAHRLPILRANNIDDGLSFDDLVYVEEALVSDEQKLREGDIVLAMSSGSKRMVGKSALVTRSFDGAFGAFCGLLRPHQIISSRFISYLLSSRPFRQHVESQALGTNINNLKREHVLEYEVALPPSTEQLRIVARIEELCSELDKGVDALEIAREQLKAYRQSVLKHAFEGKLTRGWRKQDGHRFESSAELLGRIARASEGYYAGELLAWEAALEEWTSSGEKGRKPAKPDRPADAVPVSDEEAADLPSLPPTWTYARLSTLAQIGSGMSVSKDRAIVDPLEVPYLRVANVQRGRLDLSHMARMKIERTQLRALALRTWDVLFNEGGDRDKLGRGWIWEGQIDPCITQNHVFRASPYLAIDLHAKFISYWGNTFGQDYFNTEGKQTTNLASINKGVLSAFPIPLPSLEEQAEIVNEIEYRLSLADGLQHEIDAALERHSSLRQSILAKAFSGQLVAQDPNDEPASALLEQIKAERGPSNGQKKNGRRKKEVREAA